MPRDKQGEKWSAWKVGRVTVRAMGSPREEDGRSRCRLEWYASGDDGKMSTKSIGWVDRDEAEREAHAVGVGGAKTRHEKERPTTQIQTLRDLMRGWLWHVENERPDLAENTLRIYRTSVTRIIGKKDAPTVLSPLPLRSVNAAQMQRWASNQQRLALQGRARHAGSTLQLELSILARAWIWGRARGLVEGPPPIAGVRVAAGAVYNHRTPTPGEVAATLAHMYGWGRLAVFLTWSTGARIGEIVHLTWDRVDLAAGWVKLAGKTGERDVPLSARAKAALLEEQARLQEKAEGKEAKAKAGKVGRIIEYKSCRIRDLRRMIAAACRRAGVSEWTPHGLRRLAVDELQRAGVDVGTAAAILGHSPEVMLTKYRQPTAADKKRGLEKAQLGEAPAGELLEFKPRTPEG